MIFLLSFGFDFVLLQFFDFGNPSFAFNLEASEVVPLSLFAVSEPFGDVVGYPGPKLLGHDF
jgi:hypothetical protein